MRIARLMVAAILASASSFAARAVPSDPLEGCDRMPIPGGVNIVCGGAISSIVDNTGGDVEQLRDFQIAFLRDSLHRQLAAAELTATAMVYRAGEKSWPAVRLEFRRTGSNTLWFEGHIIAFKPDANTARLAFCGGSSTSADMGPRCAVLLPLYAEKGPAPFTPVAQGARVLGKPFAVPKGCSPTVSTDALLSVDCGEPTSLIFVQLPSKYELSRAPALKRDKLLREIPGIKAGKPVPCKVIGVETSCTVLRAGEGTSEIVFRLAAAQVGDVTVFVECDQEATLAAPHAVCSGLLSF